MGSKDTQNVSTDDIEKGKRLSAVAAKALNFGEPTEGYAYRAVSLSGGGDRRAIASAFGKTAVGYRLAPVLKGKKSPFSTIGGVSTGGIPDTVFLNIDSAAPEGLNGVLSGQESPILFCEHSQF
jgi:hypothetical protein